MQSDTIIGIVGAVVLVGVMVGVFAYEFNNAPDTDTTGDPDTQQQMDTFANTYPDYAATEDMDGDGTANYMDDDIDGDGIPNADDDTIETTVSISGAASVLPTGATDSASEFEISTGATGFHVEIAYSTLGTPADSTLQTLNIAITGPDGFTGSSSTCTVSGSSAACSTSWQEPLGPGTYVATVSHNGVAGTVPVGTSLSFTGAAVVHY